MISFFFFSSRRRHTRSLRDWSSDVCSSDLGRGSAAPRTSGGRALRPEPGAGPDPRPRSAERRVGKECRSRWSPHPSKKNQPHNQHTTPPPPPPTQHPHPPSPPSNL